MWGGYCRRPEQGRGPRCRRYDRSRGSAEPACRSSLRPRRSTSASRGREFRKSQSRDHNVRSKPHDSSKETVKQGQYSVKCRAPKRQILMSSSNSGYCVSNRSLSDEEMTKALCSYCGEILIIDNKENEYGETKCQRKIKLQKQSIARIETNCYICGDERVSGKSTDEVRGFSRVKDNKWHTDKHDYNYYPRTRSPSRSPHHAHIKRSRSIDRHNRQSTWNRMDQRDNERRKTDLSSERNRSRQHVSDKTQSSRRSQNTDLKASLVVGRAKEGPIKTDISGRCQKEDHHNSSMSPSSKMLGKITNSDEASTTSSIVSTNSKLSGPISRSVSHKREHNIYHGYRLRSHTDGGESQFPSNSFNNGNHVDGSPENTISPLKHIDLKYETFLWYKFRVMCLKYMYNLRTETGLNCLDDIYLKYHTQFRAFLRDKHPRYLKFVTPEPPFFEFNGDLMRCNKFSMKFNRVRKLSAKRARAIINAFPVVETKKKDDMELSDHGTRLETTKGVSLKGDDAGSLLFHQGMLSNTEAEADNFGSNFGFDKSFVLSKIEELLNVPIILSPLNESLEDEENVSTISALVDHVGYYCKSASNLDTTLQDDGSDPSIAKIQFERDQCSIKYPTILSTVQIEADNSSMEYLQSSSSPHNDARQSPIEYALSLNKHQNDTNITQSSMFVEMAQFETYELPFQLSVSSTKMEFCHSGSILLMEGYYDQNLIEKSEYMNIDRNEIDQFVIIGSNVEVPFNETCYIDESLQNDCLADINNENNSYGGIDYSNGNFGGGVRGQGSPQVPSSSVATHHQGVGGDGSEDNEVGADNSYQYDILNNPIVLNACDRVYHIREYQMKEVNDGGHQPLDFVNVNVNDDANRDIEDTGVSEVLGQARGTISDTDDLLLVSMMQTVENGVLPQSNFLEHFLDDDLEQQESDAFIRQERSIDISGQSHYHPDSLLNQILADLSVGICDNNPQTPVSVKPTQQASDDAMGKSQISSYENFNSCSNFDHDISWSVGQQSYWYTSNAEQAHNSCTNERGLTSEQTACVLCPNETVPMADDGINYPISLFLEDIPDFKDCISPTDSTWIYDFDRSLVENNCQCCNKVKKEEKSEMLKLGNTWTSQSLIAEDPGPSVELEMKISKDITGPDPSIEMDMIPMKDMTDLDQIPQNRLPLPVQFIECVYNATEKEARVEGKKIEKVAEIEVKVENNFDDFSSGIQMVDMLSLCKRSTRHSGTVGVRKLNFESNGIHDSCSNGSPSFYGRVLKFEMPEEKLHEIEDKEDMTNCPKTMTSRKRKRKRKTSRSLKSSCRFNLRKRPLPYYHAEMPTSNNVVMTSSLQACSGNINHNSVGKSGGGQNFLQPEAVSLVDVAISTDNIPNKIARLRKRLYPIIYRRNEIAVFNALGGLIPPARSTAATYSSRNLVRTNSNNNADSPDSDDNFNGENSECDYNIESLSVSTCSSIAKEFENRNVRQVMLRMKKRCRELDQQYRKKYESPLGSTFKDSMMLPPVPVSGCQNSSRRRSKSMTRNVKLCRSSKSSFSNSKDGKKKSVINAISPQNESFDDLTMTATTVADSQISGPVLKFIQRIQGRYGDQFPTSNRMTKKKRRDLCIRYLHRHGLRTFQGAEDINNDERLNTSLCQQTPTTNVNYGHDDKNSTKSRCAEPAKLKNRQTFLNPPSQYDHNFSSAVSTLMTVSTETRMLPLLKYTNCVSHGIGDDSASNVSLQKEKALNKNMDSKSGVNQGNLAILQQLQPDCSPSRLTSISASTRRMSETMCEKSASADQRYISDSRSQSLKSEPGMAIEVYESSDDIDEPRMSLGSSSKHKDGNDRLWGILSKFEKLCPNRRPAGRDKVLETTSEQVAGTHDSNDAIEEISQNPNGMKLERKNECYTPSMRNETSTVLFKASADLMSAAIENENILEERCLKAGHENDCQTTERTEDFPNKKTLNGERDNLDYDSKASPNLLGINVISAKGSIPFERMVINTKLMSHSDILTAIAGGSGNSESGQISALETENETGIGTGVGAETGERCVVNYPRITTIEKTSSTQGNLYLEADQYQATPTVIDHGELQQNQQPSLNLAPLNIPEVYTQSCASNSQALEVLSSSCTSQHSRNLLKDSKEKSNWPTCVDETDSSDICKDIYENYNDGVVTCDSFNIDIQSGDDHDVVGKDTGVKCRPNAPIPSSSTTITATSTTLTTTKTTTITTTSYSSTTASTTILTSNIVNESTLEADLTIDDCKIKLKLGELISDNTVNGTNSILDATTSFTVNDDCDEKEEEKEEYIVGFEHETFSLSDMPSTSQNASASVDANDVINMKATERLKLPVKLPLSPIPENPDEETE